MARVLLLCLFFSCRISGARPEDTVRSNMPFLVVVLDGPDAGRLPGPLNRLAPRALAWRQVRHSVQQFSWTKKYRAAGAPGPLPSGRE
jgi:hypothetical protein